MTADEISAVSSVAQGIIALLTLIATLAITILVYIGTRGIARIEHDRGVRDAWNQIDSLILSDESVRRIAAEILPRPTGFTPSGGNLKREWLAYMVLNTLSSTFNGAQRGVTRSRSEAMATCEYQLSALVRHEDIFKLTQEGYSEAFAKFCREVRSRNA